jgi:hypothetical protein
MRSMSMRSKVNAKKFMKEDFFNSAERLILLQSVRVVKLLVESGC